MMTGNDYGWSATAAALASPNDYFEMPVERQRQHSLSRVGAHAGERQTPSGTTRSGCSSAMPSSSNGAALYRIGTAPGCS